MEYEASYSFIHYNQPGQSIHIWLGYQVGYGSVACHMTVRMWKNKRFPASSQPLSNPSPLRWGTPEMHWPAQVVIMLVANVLVPNMGQIIDNNPTDYSIIWTVLGNIHYVLQPLNTLRPRQNGPHFPDDISNAFSWMKMYELRLKFH